MEEAIEFVLRQLKYKHIFFSKNGAIWRNLVHSRAHFSLHFFAVFEVIFFKLLPLKTKKKKNLRCDLMQACTPPLNLPVYTDSRSNKLYMLKSKNA